MSATCHFAVLWYVNVHSALGRGVRSARAGAEYEIGAAQYDCRRVRFYFGKMKFFLDALETRG